MDFRDFFAIVERDLDILNPISHQKLMLLADYCGVVDGSRILDVGSGKGYMLRSWAKEWPIEGVGLEINPSFISDARERSNSDGVSEHLTFVETDAREFSSEPESFDVVTCIGAPFAIGSSDEAVEWMLRPLRPGGALAIGDVYLKSEPPDGVASEETLSQFRTLIDNHDALEEQGLRVTGVISASDDDWDRYCSAGWRTVYDWTSENREHPDLREVSNTTDEARREYLTFQKHYLGWAILVGRFG